MIDLLSDPSPPGSESREPDGALVLVGYAVASEALSVQVRIIGRVSKP